jgi:flagellin
MSLRIN